jgi:two-component system OmpR family response regulator
MALIPEGSSASDVLELGADAVSYTPICWDEFEARIDGLLGRFGGGDEPVVLVDGPVTINRRDRTVVCPGRDIDLTATEFRVLVALARRPGEALSHAELVESIWRDAYHAKEELKIYVSYLRKKFRPTGIDPIETVRGIGYRYRPRPPTGGVGGVDPRGEHRRELR